MKNILYTLALLVCFSSFGQEDEITVPFAIIETAPVFPGCENNLNNEARKKCMSEKISTHVNRKFNIGLAEELGLSGRQRISVIFKINKNGDIVEVRSRAPHPRLEKEAVKVIKSLPKMKPGRQRGKPVIVQYALPILFDVESNYNHINASPQSVVQAIFDAAKSNDFKGLKYLCSSEVDFDGDVYSICNLENESQKIKDEFIAWFKNGQINNLMPINNNGYEASVWIIFGPKTNKDEKINLVKNNNKWYLSSF
tara:strand:- start:2958 stop:3719 length:762 start_codon:yes stop_codon:yes gene_type:complete